MFAHHIVGFGEYGHNAEWPNGARIAVSFVLNYEEGGERNPMDGDGTSEPYLWEKGPTGGGREERHLNCEHDYEYGSRCGAWRILRLMKEFGWNMTLWAIAVAMERNPTFAKACVREGHEIGAHGYRWLDIWDYSLEEEKAYIKKTCQALEAATGKFKRSWVAHLADMVTGEFPVGAYFGRGTPQTASLLPIMWKELGKKMLYSSEVYNEDSPYWIDLPWEKDLPTEEKEGLLMLPYNYDCE
jgi:peptidoglycan/xylan/chitin deacetylase (PgdA/CDA1 family)